MPTNILVLTLLVFSLCIAAEEPVSHRAARLLQPGIADIFTESAIGSLFSYNQSTPISKTLHSPIGSFKAYRPDIFHRLRRHSGLNEEAFITALNPDNLVCISSDSKSGSAFWKTVDNDLVLKTIKHYECKNLLSCVDELLDHVLSEMSGIGAVLGVYRVKLKGGQKRYFMIAKNVFSCKGRVIRKYDLKGSTVGRRSKPSSEVLKDINLKESLNLLDLGQSKHIALHILNRDADFLMRHGFMDYSLLVAEIEKPPFRSHSLRNIFPRTTEAFVSAETGKLMCQGESGLMYQFGIIDFLQRYTLRKYLENFFKGFIFDARKISCVNPQFYARRFIEFLNTYSS